MPRAGKTIAGTLALTSPAWRACNPERPQGTKPIKTRAGSIADKSDGHHGQTSFYANTYVVNFAEMVTSRGLGQVRYFRYREGEGQGTNTVIKDASYGAGDNEGTLLNFFVGNDLRLYVVIDKPRHEAGEHYGWNVVAVILLLARDLKDIRAVAQSTADVMATAGR